MRKKVPDLKRHATGQGYVRVRGKNVYFGLYGKSETQQAYHRWAADFLSGGPPAPAGRPLTVLGLAALYVPWAEQEFVKHGRPTRQAARIKIALRPLAEQFGRLELAAFGVPEMEALARAYVARGWTRGFCNACLGCVKAMFKWAALREHLAMDHYLRLRHTPNLRRGRTAAPEAEEVLPVEEAVVERTLPRLGRIPAAMVRVQLLAGMRPGEVCAMRVGDLDRAQTPWVYRPGSHKTEHHGENRTIFLGPRAREVLAPFVLRAQAGGPEAYLFNSAEAFAEWAAGRTCAPPAPRPGSHYTVHGYTQAVVRACKRAGVPRWTPLQLRHTRGTETRARFGPDAARAQLGHRSLQSTEVYAELDLRKAADAAEATG